MNKLIQIILLTPYLFVISSAEVKNSISKNPFIAPQSVQANKMQELPEVSNRTSLTDENLRATLQSSDRSLANIDGMMVFEGETIKGYTLISVGEGSATLEKNGKKIILNVSELHKKLK